MPNWELTKDSLVLYKNEPARVTQSADKLEIQTRDGENKKVRSKDVTPLHPGPITNLAELKPIKGELETAWELLAGGETTLAELSELIFEDFTPTSAWATWALVAEGKFFSGEPDSIRVKSADEMEAEQAELRAKEEEAQAWDAFISRVKSGKVIEEDDLQLREVAALARGKTNRNKVLKAIKLQPTPENAHGLLLRLGYWNEQENPYPHRQEVNLEPHRNEVGEPPEEARRDLTHLEAYAIDDAGNKDPDDAISFDGTRIWVHVADVSALVPPDSPIDLEARERGATLYLPEGNYTMLPERATALLGLGLQEVSPALSFGFTVDAEGTIDDIEITPSLVKVTRCSYAEAELLLQTGSLAEILKHTNYFRRKRIANHAAMIDLPEAKVKVVEGKVHIHPLEKFNSREMVTDAMLMAGEAAARFAQARQIPIPYAAQDPPDQFSEPASPAEMFAYRKQFKASRIQGGPMPHAGLGLEIYTRATSPLRRYTDLLVHQQLRAHLKGEPTLEMDELLLRFGAASTAAVNTTRAERNANRHWTLVFLLQNPHWRGKGVLVDKRGKRGVVIIPELGMDFNLNQAADFELNDTIELTVKNIDLPNLGIQLTPI